MRWILVVLFALAACSGSNTSGGDMNVAESEGEAEGEAESEAEGDKPEPEAPFDPELGCDPPEFERLDVEPFEEVAVEVGLGQVDAVSAVCLFDYDTDSDPDLYLATDGLFRNDDGSFLLVAVFAPPSGHSCLAFDYDMDSDPDLLTLGNSGTRLYENRGGTFVDVAGVVGLGWAGGLSQSAAACDIESDGDLDIVVTSSGARTRLFTNEGGWSESAGFFSEEGEARGFSPADDPKHSVVCADVTGDTHPDILLVGEGGGSTRLYWNEGDGNFTEGGVEDFGFARVGSGHGIAVGDYDLDSQVDVLVGAIDLRAFVFDGNPEEEPVFREVSKFVGFDEPMQVKHPARGVGLFDFDQDGLPDLFITRRGRTQFYWNEDGIFVEANGGAAFDASPYSRGTAFGDIDGDGDVDVVVANSSAEAPNGALGGRLVVYRNEVASGNWLRVRLVGTTSNSQGVGAVVTVAAEGGCSYTAEQTAGGSFLATNESVLHFGLGTATLADVTVEWPTGGGTSTVADVAVNQTITVTE